MTHQVKYLGSSFNQKESLFVLIIINQTCARIRGKGLKDGCLEREKAPCGNGSRTSGTCRSEGTNPSPCPLLIHGLWNGEKISFDG